MNRLSCFVIVSTLFSAPAFAADAPTLVNQDAAYYGITLDCPGSEAGEQ